MAKMNAHDTVIRVRLVPAPSDPPQFSDEYQEILQRLIAQLEFTGVKVTPFYDMHAAAGVSGGLNGDLKLVLQIVGALATLFGTWFHGRNGRTVKLTIDGTEIEARSVEDVERLLTAAHKYKRDTKPTNVL